MGIQSLLKYRPNSQAAAEGQLLDWLQLIRSRNVGPITFYKLLENYGSAAAVLKALPDLASRGGARSYAVYDRSAAAREMKQLAKRGGRFIGAYDPRYPDGLRAIDDAPPVLAALGDVDLLSKRCVSIVGARNASINGKMLAKKMAGDLGGADYVVASGLARGIDTAVHEGSLASGTIAVLAGGVDICYPQDNQKLYDAIAKQGLLLSENPLGTQPKMQHFPRRNRIVSGLSAGVVVVEATLKSGSLITARMAGEQGREVMAVPGHPADPRASGPNALIRDGALLVRHGQDILEHLASFSGCSSGHSFEYSGGQPRGLSDSANDDMRFADRPPKKPPEITDSMRTLVIENLSYVPVSLDELLRTCELTHGALQTILLELELAGRVQRLPGSCVVMIES